MPAKRMTRLYKAWLGMKDRCRSSPKNRVFHLYAGRGIKVCREWLNDFPRFRAWALANRYRKGLTLERKNNNKGYAPRNCKWATYTQQNRNKRNNTLVTAFGETKCLAEWVEDRRCRVSSDTLQRRLRVYGFEPERAISQPCSKDSPRCKRGHKYTSDNVLISGGKRTCKRCHKDWLLKWRSRNMDRIRMLARESARRRKLGSSSHR
jgi:hypothetical protein